LGAAQVALDGSAGAPALPGLKPSRRHGDCLAAAVANDVMMSSETNAVVVVVGGSGGIGSSVARQLQAQGAQVAITGRNAEHLAVVGAETGAQTFELDARDSAAVEAVLQSVQKTHGRLDGVVNCAGSILLKPAHLTSDQEFSDTLAINLGTAFNVLRAAVRLMMRQDGGGSVVLCSSVAARRGLANHEAIAAAKAGVEGLALAAAASYARYRVRVNCVAPSLTRTGLTRALTQNEAVAKTSAALHPLGRIGEPEDVASAICWLLDRRQSWVTAQVIGVDGGLGHSQGRG
jgi:NAD(P)-dependent dehydrogenase (short-subunit alcohol dehydrogenase family)